MSFDSRIMLGTKKSENYSKRRVWSSSLVSVCLEKVKASVGEPADVERVTKIGISRTVY